MAKSVVSFVAERLGDLLIQEPNFLCKVNKQVKQMHTELKLMQCLIRQDEDEAVCNWVSEVREAAYDAEDVIESFALKIASRRRGGGIQNAFRRYPCVINEVIEIHNVLSEIEAIKSRISRLRTSLPTYGIPHKSEGESSSSAHSMQQLVEEDIDGLDEDVKTLVEQLVLEEKHCRVVSIWGMGGLGKTTLAKKVSRHKDISSHFEGRLAWANASQQCQPRDVWEEILFQLISPSNEKIKEEFKRLRDEELAKTLYEEQLKKKCLVILDDIWTTEAWDNLRDAFPIRKAGSKMLLTTRNKDVALHVDPRGFLYEPRCLTGDESWELLKKASSRKNPDHMKKMLERCAGLPLAIVVLGGLLASKHTLNKWDMLRDAYLRRGKDHERQQLGLFEVLALSYNELPYQLKPCFLHLGHFQENSDIPTKKLVRMWVAEGILSPMQYEVGGEETLEDVAERYLGELINRCMVQVGVRGSTGRVKTCRLHNCMRELCLLIANQENFLKIVHNQDGNEPTIANSSGPVRRLAIYLSEESYENSFREHERPAHLRSLLFFSTITISQDMTSVFTDFNLLRVLDLEQCCIEGELARGIGNLRHLRYLSLYFRNLTKLPSSIGKLKCLQTLILKSGDTDKIWVPNVIWKMEQLRHLYLSIFIKESSPKLRLRNLSNLQTLQGFDARRFNVKELIKLTNLKKLGIVEFDCFKEILKSSSIITFNSLHSLKIITSLNSPIKEFDLQRLLSGCKHLYKLCLNGSIEDLPGPRHFPPNLTILTLSFSKLQKDPMETLGWLPNLIVLRLREDAFMGKIMVICPSKGFLQLKSLVLCRLPNLEELHVYEEAMPILRELVIQDCPRLKMLKRLNEKEELSSKCAITLRQLKINGVHEAFENRPPFL